MGLKEDADKELTNGEPSFSRAARMEKTLRDAYRPHALSIEDQSARHRGHAGARAEGESHYAIRMVSDAFAGLSRVARQRAVMQTLADEFSTGLHALSLDLKTSGEAQ